MNRRGWVRPGDKVWLILDSSHAKAHVAKELEAYAPFVTPGSYIVATDGIMGLVHICCAASRNGFPTIPTQAASEFAAGILTSFSRNQNGGSMKMSSIERSQLGREPGSSESDQPRGAMMQDFILVIPTYNRAKQLEALLTYLGAQQSQCHVLILVSASRSNDKPIARLPNWQI